MSETKVYWITGLSGAGKTTIGHILRDKLKVSGHSVVYLDGDVLREILSSTTAHTVEERKALAMCYSRLCKMLVDQGMNVVCATISMFNSIRQWNRDHIDSYVEIYLDVPIDVLIQRDQKALYTRALQGQVENVLGINAPFEIPENADIVMVNDGKQSPEQITDNILEQLGLFKK